MDTPLPPTPRAEPWNSFSSWSASSPNGPVFRPSQPGSGPRPQLSASSGQHLFRQWGWLLRGGQKPPGSTWHRIQSLRGGGRLRAEASTRGPLRQSGSRRLGRAAFGSGGSGPAACPGVESTNCCWEDRPWGLLVPPGGGGAPGGRGEVRDSWPLLPFGGAQAAGVL